MQFVDGTGRNWVGLHKPFAESLPANLETLFPENTRFVTENKLHATPADVHNQCRLRIECARCPNTPVDVFRFLIAPK